MWNCPNCGKSHYSDGAQFSTDAYYPPVMKDGVNVNPDRNIITGQRRCMECGAEYMICNGETLNQTVAPFITT